MSEAAVVIEQTTSTGIVEFNQFEHDLAEYKKRYELVVYDMTVPAQEKQARSDRLSIGKKVAELDRVHAAIKAPLKAKVDLLDGERKRIKDGLLQVQEGIKSQIAAHEAKLQAIEDALVARVDAIKALAVFEFPPTSDQVMTRLRELGKLVIDESFAHHAADALAARKSSAVLLDALYDQVSQREAEVEELARLKAEAEIREREEREAKIAADAAAKAKQEAEAAIESARQATLAAQQAAAEAEERAEQEAHDAKVREEQARIKAKRDADEAARLATEAAEKAQRDQQEQERKATEAREADEKHRKQVKSDAVAALMHCFDIGIERATGVIEMIDQGRIPNIKIHY